MSVAIVILGGPNDQHGNLSQIALARAEAAFLLFEQIPKSSILCTGGFGAHFNTTTIPYCEYLKQKLISFGVPSTQFLPYALSRYTIGDALMSKPILAKFGIRSIHLVTSTFHMKRANSIFSQLCPNITISKCSAKTPVDALELKQLTAHEDMVFIRDNQSIRELIKGA